MNIKKTIVVAGFMFLLAIFAIPVSAANNSCLDCHEKLTAFSEKEKELNDIRIEHLQRGVACSLECHATTINEIAKSNYEQWTNSKHALFNVTCDNCHGGNSSSDVKEIAHVGVLNASESNSSVFYRNVPETCGKCHKDELNQFKDSLHYQNLRALKQAPSCDTCHMPHEFRVLNASEFQNVCSSCHNIDMKIAPDVPDKAMNAIENAENLKTEIRTADAAIREAKQQGKDVTSAQKELEAAISIRDNLPIFWHSFNLPNFQNVTDNGIIHAKAAQNDLGLSPTKQPSTPGFGAILSLTGIISIYLLMQKRKRKDN
jgi:hypothetical protein